jgi:hypothetical protein
MTEQQREQMLKALAERAEKNKDPMEARRFLISTGTYTADGELAASFGGPGFNDLDD